VAEGKWDGAGVRLEHRQAAYGVGGSSGHDSRAGVGERR